MKQDFISFSRKENLYLIDTFNCDWMLNTVIYTTVSLTFNVMNFTTSYASVTIHREKSRICIIFSNILSFVRHIRNIKIPPKWTFDVTKFRLAFNI